MISPHILIIIHSGLLILLLVINGTTDLVRNKLYNAVNFPAIVLGILVNILWGLDALQFSIIGLVIGFGLFFIVFLIGSGAMGGGDVKFMAAVGAIGIPRFQESVGGYPFILWASFYSALVGGLIAIIAMIAKGRLIYSLKNVARTTFTFLLPFLKTVPLKPEDSIKVPFGFGIAVGTLWTWWLYAFGVLK
ncbi:prepilin peptidase [candidate division CSSED10-310 bacterium]|uniref:Prepilin peptidase n=1 Tax=candidate division CSSED10-310 bacterium TaxID=2855610 RepID=A0ABV6Z0H6_UNCC1